MDTTTSRLDAALNYAARGWPVLPLHTPVEVSTDYPSGCDCRRECTDVGKHPRTEKRTRGQSTLHGVNDASADPERIRHWWGMWPTANVGVSLAGARLLDIAPDSPEWHAEFIARGLPPTLTFASGGGEGHIHYLYVMPEGVPQARLCRSGEFDILAAGYAVMPPSKHASGLEYVWLYGPDERPAGEAPNWARALLAERPKGHAATVDHGGEVTKDEAFNRLLESVDMAAWSGTQFEGDRSKGLYAISSELAKAGANLDTIVYWLGERDDTLGWHKYSDRTDRDERYEELAEGALERAAQEPVRIGVATARARSNGTSPPPGPPVEPDDEVLLAPFPEPPLDVLPMVCQELIADSNLPPPAMMGGFLGALAAAVGGYAEVEIGSTFKERAILWPCIITPPGTGKSSVMDLAYGPVDAEDQRRHERYLDDLTSYLQDLDDCDDAAAKKQFKRDHPMPTDRSRLLDDTTQEAMVSRMREQPSACLKLDELKQLLKGLGEYKGQSETDTARLLKAWHGAAISYNRQHLQGRPIRVPRPTLVICGPLVLDNHRMLGEDTDGMRPRWLPHVWNGQAPEDLKLPDDALVERYARLVDALQGRDRLKRKWVLLAPVRRRFEELHAGWAKRSNAVNISPGMQNALRKADRQVLRIALVLAETDLLMLPQLLPGEIEVTLDLPLSALERAARWFDYILACWECLPGSQPLELKREDAALNHAVDRWVAWLDTRSGWHNVNALRHNGVGGVDTAAGRDAVAARFRARYPSAVKDEKPASGGRPTVFVSSPRRTP